jgi:hypothetical protein
MSQDDGGGRLGFLAMPAVSAANYAGSIGLKRPAPAICFYCIFTATAAAVQQARHIRAATMSGVISKYIANQLLR